jgi:uncharacterized protein
VNFWDTSAIVPLVLEEPSTPTADTLFEDDPDVLAWWTTRAELLSALARRVREGRIKPAKLDSIMARADAIWSKTSIIGPEPAILDITQRLLFAYPLRASDALQLAAAVAIVDGRPDEIAFLSFDHRLRAAASAEGFAVLPA